MKSVGREGEEQLGTGTRTRGGGNGESLKLLDAACLCSICHSKFDAPLLLRGCGHSFCSACIRQSLDFQEKSNSGPNCPTCRTPCDARDLVPNVALREVVYHFAACKQHLLAEFRDQEVEKQQKCGPTTRSRSRQTRAEPGYQKSKEKEGHDGASPLHFWEDEDDENDEEWDEEGDEGDEGDGEFSPVKKKPRRQKEAGKDENSSHGFVDCPICGRAVPAFYINSHVDQCLISTSENSRSHKAIVQNQKKSSDSVVQDEKASCMLTVPPRLVPTLVSEKSLRAALRKYGLPSEGRKSELLERYNRMRLAVETANDKGEAVSYAKLAHKVMAQERQRAVASLLVQTDNINGSFAKPGALHVENTTTIDKDLDVDKNSVTYVVGPGTSFKELIAVTKARDAARKRERETRN